MLRQQTKDLYFLVNRVAVLPATWLASWRFRKPTHPEGWYLHLGSGQDYRPDLINIDGNFFQKKDLWLDLRNPLPFGDRSAALVFCCHTLEHFFPDEALRILREIHRVLSDDGVARIATPSIEHALRIAAGTPWTDPKRVFNHPMGQMVDYLFCDGQHRYAYSFDLLRDFANQAGFTRVVNYSAEHGTQQKQYGRVIVGNEHEGSLVVELRR